MNGNETVTRLRPNSTTDAHGNEVADWTDPAEVEVPGCLFAPGTTSEDNLTRTATVAQPTLYAPVGADIATGDRVVVRGNEYDVDGVPGDWRGIGGTLGGLEVPLKVVAG